MRLACRVVLCAVPTLISKMSRFDADTPANASSPLALSVRQYRLVYCYCYYYYFFAFNSLRKRGRRQYLTTPHDLDRSSAFPTRLRYCNDMRCTHVGRAFRVSPLAAPAR